MLSSTEKLFCYDTKTAEIAKNLDIVKNINNWLPNINPNCDRFDISLPYLNNRGSCAFAIYHRFEGRNPDACALAVNIGYYFQMEQPTGLKQVKNTLNEIESYLLVAGNGARGIVGVDRSFGPGHWFNAVCINNKVYAIDGQSGEMIEWPPNYGNVVNWEMSVGEV